MSSYDDHHVLPRLRLPEMCRSGEVAQAWRVVQPAGPGSSKPIAPFP